jgi:putative tryptophan/tyrosine transport system substrate-binding protein
MERRTFMALVAGSVLAAPLAAGAQQPGKVYRLGVMLASSASNNPLLDAFRQRLRELGWVEGKNIELEIRGDGTSERYPAIAAELIRLRVDMIVVGNGPAAAAARNATSTLPIVMASVGNPVGRGLVDTIARPGGNITGLSLMDEDIVGKQLQVLKEAIPQASRVSVLRTAPARVLSSKNLEVAAQLLAIQPQTLGVRSPEEFDDAFSTMIRGRSDALFVMSDSMFFVHRKRLADLAIKFRLPTMFAGREYAEAGGLMAYGPSSLHTWHRAAIYVDKILKGAKPADLPIEQPTQFELVINLKTAKALGVTIPPSLLGRADRVIQ